MKNYIYILTLSILCLYSCHAQLEVNYDNFNDGPNEGKYFKDINNNFDPFLGTWQWQDNNQIFRITLWKEQEIESYNGINNPVYYMDKIQGHFEMVEVGQQGQQFETVIYTSDKPIGTSSQYYPPVINGSSYDGISAGGLLIDNSNINPSNYFGVRCQFTLDIISSNPTQAVFKVKSLSMSGDTYNIPSNITMTKQF
jgi:hypothetical protein